MGVVYCTTVVAFFFVLIACQITTSSIGTFSTTGVTDSSVIAGSPQPIRSDEYLRGSPGTIGGLQATTPTGIGSPLSYSPPVLSGSPALWVGLAPWINPVNYAISKLLSHASIGVQFSWTWWRPTILLLLALPLLLRLIGVRWLFAIVGTLLVWLSAPVQWWSYYPIESIGPAALGGLLVLAGLRVARTAEASRTQLAAGALIAALGGAQVPIVLSSYIIWSAPVVVFVIAITMGAVIGSHADIRSRIITVTSASVAAVLVTGLWLVNFRATASIILNTVFPGSRRSEGATQVPHWAGDLVWTFQDRANIFASSNQSELAIGFIGASIVSGIVIFVPSNWAYMNRVDRSTRVAAKAGFLVFAIFLLWTLTIWPDFAATMNPLKFVLPDRMLQILGPLCMILFALALEFSSVVAHHRTWRTAVLMGAIATCVLSLQSGSEMKLGALPFLTNSEVWISGIFFAFAIAAPFLFHQGSGVRRIVLLLPILLFAIFSVYSVNPVQFGTGALTDAPIAKAIRDQNAADPGRWATEGIFNDALMLASGVPELSGQQSSGPNEQAWTILDPLTKSKDAWNRGASYITFSWTQDEAATISNPSPDMINVAVSPCSPLMRELGLRWVISGQTLDQGCAALVRREYWQGSLLNIYNISN